MVGTSAFEGRRGALTPEGFPPRGPPCLDASRNPGGGSVRFPTAPTVMGVSEFLLEPLGLLRQGVAYMASLPSGPVLFALLLNRNALKFLVYESYPF